MSRASFISFSLRFVDVVKHPSPDSTPLPSNRVAPRARGVYPRREMEKRKGCDVLVVGGGPAGVIAALHAAKAGAETCLVDSRPVPGEKILLSGGGRCNILPLSVDPNAYGTSSSPHTLRKILLSWPLDEVRAFLENSIGLRLIEQKRTGKVYPASGGGEEVRDRFLAALRRSKVRMLTRTRVIDIQPSERRRVVLEGRPGIVADQVVVASGGLSYPRTGSSGFGFTMAEALGHQVVPPYPALVPLLSGRFEHTALAGISLPVRVEIGDGREKKTGTGDFLFTHRGYSGPVILNLSCDVTRALVAGKRLAVRVAWLNRVESDWEEALASSHGTVRGVLKSVLPDRLGDRLLEELNLWDSTVASLHPGERARLLRSLVAYELPWVDSAGYREAEATGGGVPLGEIDPKTMQSRVVPCVHFCGEVLDAVGPIGGYNFLWAFVTGRLAGEGAAQIAKA
jgi:predicted Rossmann fold flavoprotein